MQHQAGRRGQHAAPGEEPSPEAGRLFVLVGFLEEDHFASCAQSPHRRLLHSRGWGMGIAVHGGRWKIRFCLCGTDRG